MVEPIEKFRLPGMAHRTAIYGRNGSGKTMFGAFLLSRQPLERYPWHIVDYKGDDLFRKLDRIKEIGLREKLPKHAGLYVVRPRPDETATVEEWLWKVYEAEKRGLFFDEAYMLPNSQGRGAFQALLTQGRSKRIPSITLTQRPAWISPFVFSEANFHAVFHLQRPQDYKRVEEFMPDTPEWNLAERRPEYTSRWYDVDKDRSFFLSPAPPSEQILDDIDFRLRPKRSYV